MATEKSATASFGWWWGPHLFYTHCQVIIADVYSRLWSPENWIITKKRLFPDTKKTKKKTGKWKSDLGSNLLNKRTFKSTLQRGKVAYSKQNWWGLSFCRNCTFLQLGGNSTFLKQAKSHQLKLDPLRIPGSRSFYYISKERTNKDS